MATKKTQKTCFIAVRYFFKKTGSVCCIVRNEKGEEYKSCIHTNGRTSCVNAVTGEECRGHKYSGHCYHVNHVKAAEAARPENQECTTPTNLFYGGQVFSGSPREAVEQALTYMRSTGAHQVCDVPLVGWVFKRDGKEICWTNLEIAEMRIERAKHYNQPESLKNYQEWKGLIQKEVKGNLNGSSQGFGVLRGA